MCLRHNPLWMKRLTDCSEFRTEWRERQQKALIALVSPHTCSTSSALTFRIAQHLKIKKATGLTKSDLRKGDLVFFDTSGGKGISHVGIYLGDGEFIHSASNEGIVKNKLSESYYAKRYVSARRVLWDDIYNQLTAESN